MKDNKIKILLAEDDLNLGSLLMQYLNAKGFDAQLFADGEKAYEGYMKGTFDICILDVMMPKKDGFALAREIRMTNSRIPIIFLTAKALKEDVLEGFKIGADDYLTKPFIMDELLLRIEAIMRRVVDKNDGKLQSEFYEIGKYKFDVTKQLLYFEGEEAKLTTKESELLALLCANKNNMLERNFALKAIWNEDNYYNARSMDVYITKLRKHLSKDDTIELLNVHGKGYKLVSDS